MRPGAWLVSTFAGAAVLLAASPAFAAPIAVNTTSDAAAAAGECSGGAHDCALRQAVDKATTGDTISLPASGTAYAITLGDIDIGGKNLTIQGAGARITTIQSNGSSRIFSVSGGTATVNAVTLTGGGGVDPGGAINNAGQLTLNAVTVRANAATGSNGIGGGIYSTGDLTITGSTVSGNTATGTGLSPHEAEGGGLVIKGATLTLTNSTVSGNTVAGNGSFTQGFGGGIFNYAGSTVTLQHDTIASNTATGKAGSSGGNIYNEDSTSAASATSTIIAYGNANGTPSSVGSAAGGANCAGAPTMTSNGHNLEDGTSCGFTQTSDKDADPNLGSLTDNGGQADTRALLAGSPAIDAGATFGCGPGDERGSPRPDNGESACDIGAYEFQDPKRRTSTTVSCTPNPDEVGHQTACTATVTDIGTGIRKPPNGQATFHGGQGTFDKSSCTLMAGSGHWPRCTVRYKPSSLGTGSQRIAASYGGSATHGKSSGSTTLKVIPARSPTKTKVKCHPHRTRVNDEVVCKATVKDLGHGKLSPPTGNIAFSTNSDGGFIGPNGARANHCKLKANSVVKSSCSLHYRPVKAQTGKHRITAHYEGDAKHEASEGSTRLKVVANATSTRVECHPNPARVKRATACVVVVKDVGSAPLSSPAGLVEVSAPDASGQIGCQLKKQPHFEASCKALYTPTKVGTQVVTARYPGDSRHAKSTGSTSLTVNHAP
jgi:hypothetical protein